MSCATPKPALLLAAVVAALLTGAARIAASAEGDVVVSQKNRLFNPLDITVAKDRPVVIVNDDADLMHHAYVESDEFSFDSGDQTPGSRTTVAFPVRGDFKVLCGIHPKMKLAVHVR